MRKEKTKEENAPLVEMHRLYAKYGNYAEVGRQIGRSGSTVSKYIKMVGVPQNLKIAVENLIKHMKTEGI